MHEVVLGWVGTVVVVEARVHASELRQAHRHVAVVEHDRNPEPLAECGGNASEVRHRDGEEHDGIGALSLDEPLEVAPPARRDDAPDRLTGDPVERRLLRLVLRAPQIPIALESGEAASDSSVGLGLAVRGVGSGSPPWRLHGPPPVRRDHEIDAGLVHPFPQLPPCGSAAVAKVEVDGGRDGDDLRRVHPGKSRGIGSSIDLLRLFGARCRPPKEERRGWTLDDNLEPQPEFAKQSRPGCVRSSCDHGLRTVGIDSIDDLPIGEESRHEPCARTYQRDCPECSAGLYRQ